VVAVELPPESPAALNLPPPTRPGREPLSSRRSRRREQVLQQLIDPTVIGESAGIPEQQSNDILHVEHPDRWDDPRRRPASEGPPREEWRPRNHNHFEGKVEPAYVVVPEPAPVAEVAPEIDETKPLLARSDHEIAETKPLLAESASIIAETKPFEPVPQTSTSFQIDPPDFVHDHSNEKGRHHSRPLQGSEPSREVRPTPASSPAADEPGSRRVNVSDPASRRPHRGADPARRGDRCTLVPAMAPREGDRYEICFGPSATNRNPGGGRKRRASGCSPASP